MVKDWTYQATFRQEDLPAVQEMVRHIRENHDVGMIREINERLETRSTTLANGIPIIGTAKSEDLVVNSGLQQCINIMLGTSSARWSHIGTYTTGGAAAAVTNTALTAGEVPSQRIVLSTNGWAESSGMTILFGGILSQTVSASMNPIAEMGVFNGGSAGATLLNRSLFAQNVIDRGFGGTGPSLMYRQPAIISCVVEFCPVA